MQRALGTGAVERALDSLAIDGDYFARQGWGDGSHPLAETLLHLLRVEQREYPPEGVVGGNAAGQVEKRRRPRLLQLPIVRDVDPRFGPGHHGADGDDQQVEQAVPGAPGTARVWKRGERSKELIEHEELNNV